MKENGLREIAYLHEHTPGPVGRGGGQTCTKTFLEQVGTWVQNFIQIGVGVWISISPPHTNRQTNKQTNKQTNITNKHV